MNLFSFCLPLLPLLNALYIGMLLLTDRQQIKQVKWSSQLTLGLSTLVSGCLLIADQIGAIGQQTPAFTWLNSDSLNISLSLNPSTFQLSTLCCCALLLFVLASLSAKQMQQEAGFQRFFFVFNLCSAALYLLILAGNMAITFIAWQMTNVCAYFLVAYAYDQYIPALNATRVFMTQRIGDACFLLGIGFTYSWIGSLEWQDLFQSVPDLGVDESSTLAICFALAAFAKSAQLPFSPWLIKALESPTPACAAFFSASLIHSGVFLTISLHQVFAQSTIAMSLLVIVGSLTALYGAMVALTQTDLKSSLGFAMTAHLGVMFILCGLAYWQLAAIYMLVHALTASYQMLQSPQFITNTQLSPAQLLPKSVAEIKPLYVASLQRFWLDPLTDWLLVNPVIKLGKDLSYFDDHIINALMGTPAPAINALATLAQLEEHQIGAQLDNDSDTFARGSGLAAKLTEATAALIHWLEDRLLIQGIHQDSIRYGDELGLIANRIEQLLLRPRYLSLFVFITLLAVF